MVRNQNPPPKINNFEFLEKEKPFIIGDISITPYWMDHSAYDAYALSLESKGKTLFYSGDFRGHGRKAKVFKRFTQIAPQNVDYLLMEGTQLGRKSKKIHLDLIKQILDCNIENVILCGKLFKSVLNNFRIKKNNIMHISDEYLIIKFL